MNGSYALANKMLKHLFQMRNLQVNFSKHLRKIENAVDVMIPKKWGVSSEWVPPNYRIVMLFESYMWI